MISARSFQSKNRFDKLNDEAGMPSTAECATASMIHW
jgi:hypothetical protein